ncbi:hypothetical protein COW36_09220 [bacterium (Candidatus Blackallbacteria) CG17_big_fil_post_rev_8_21_14_2_50_48_46]|uniref:tRNA_anti-like n=1 Tax=bacterium (Candidatus Blackallbacteria) CG17_big_fil_post_rev_8_21_14_2_50_48_46 TaxID=2014261 RepID=A0A2M7G642_9BACT|nr:MAG: hypothetical protein COW64_23830 [bacterium (Candidatus Blackallbacteria) CG18_big_fil_WC_8_21_14_2_50_49_26]PIW17346.1 MAG: hypothetical protein COW36_09220 [bacterium (Candidatus Blackallbacteria) CG17_big_fil_post_rev_8_21_14_2_50_48_46]PIW47422.1 MAG: hypothetical protein COW20_12610 [bacterium (Candidatus Blackallbacteria) CG13_big_fil_rev_8_21_14_2_50_49_14]
MKFLKGCLTIFGALFLLLVVVSIIGVAMQSPEERKKAEQQAEIEVKKSEEQEAAKEKYRQKMEATKAAEEKAKLATVTASQIIKVYDNNKLKAEQEYKGKRFIIKGFVSSIGDDFLGNPYFTFGSGEQIEIPSLQCLFKKKEADKLTKLNKGQPITVEGTIDDFSMNIIVRDCKF